MPTAIHVLFENENNGTNQPDDKLKNVNVLFVYALYIPSSYYFGAGARQVIPALTRGFERSKNL